MSSGTVLIAQDTTISPSNHGLTYEAMAVSIRLQYLLLASWLFLASTTTATPIGPPWISHQLAKRHDNVVTLDNGTMVVVDPETSQPLAQELASDGSGHDFDAAAIIWLAWSFAVGVPLALGGIKLWRLTTGASLGIAAAVLGMSVPSPASRNMSFLLVLYNVC